MKELSFEQALKKRISYLKGLRVDQLKALFDTVHLTPGTEDLISALHFMG